MLLHFKARLGSLGLKHQLGSEVTEKADPDKAVSSAQGGSGKPPQAWDPCWVPLAAHRESVTFCRGLRIYRRIKTAVFKVYTVGPVISEQVETLPLVPRVGDAEAKRPREVLVVLQLGVALCSEQNFQPRGCFFVAGAAVLYWFTVGLYFVLSWWTSACNMANSAVGGCDGKGCNME